MVATNRMTWPSFPAWGRSSGCTPNTSSSSFTERHSCVPASSPTPVTRLITRIVEFDTEGNYQSWSANAGEMVTKGLELTVQTSLFDELELELSTTVQKTEDERMPDVTVAYSPEVLGYGKAACRIAEGLTCALTATYVGEMEASWDETKENNEGGFGARIGETAPDRLTLGANLRWEHFPWRGLSMNARGSNLLDEEIRYPTFTNNGWADRGTLDHGRTFMISLGWEP